MQIFTTTLMFVTILAYIALPVFAVIIGNRVLIKLDAIHKDVLQGLIIEEVKEPAKKK